MVAFSSLPGVLKQLILQFCDLRALLRCIRLSHHIRKVADAPYVFKFLRLAVSSRARRLTPVSSSSLLRHVALTLVFDWHDTKSTSIAAVLDQLRPLLVTELIDERTDLEANR